MVRIKKNNFVYKKNIYQCIVPGCQNIDNDTNDPSIFYYIITENRLNQKSLIEFLENIPIRPKVSRICSEHFTNDCFQLQRGIKMLKPNAVPTIKSKTKPRILIDKTDFINRTGALDKITNNNNNNNNNNSEKVDTSENNNTKYDDKILMGPPQTPVVKKSQIQILKDIIIISPQVQLQPVQQLNSTSQKQQQSQKSSHQQPEQQQQKQLDNTPYIQKLLKNNIELVLVPLQQQQPNNRNLKQLQQVVLSPQQQNNKEFNNRQEQEKLKQQPHQKSPHLKSQHNVSQNLQQGHLKSVSRNLQQGNLKPVSQSLQQGNLKPVSQNLQQGNLKPLSQNHQPGNQKLGDQQIMLTLRLEPQLPGQLQKNSINLPHKPNIGNLENQQKCDNVPHKQNMRNLENQQKRSNVSKKQTIGNLENQQKRANVPHKQNNRKLENLQKRVNVPHKQNIGNLENQQKHADVPHKQNIANLENQQKRSNVSQKQNIANLENQQKRANVPHKQNIGNLENQQKRANVSHKQNNVQPPNPLENLQKPQNKGKKRRKENNREHNESLKKLAQRVKLTHQHQKLKQLQSPREQSIFSVEEHNEYLEQLQQNGPTHHQQQSPNKISLENKKELNPSPQKQQQPCKESIEQVQQPKLVQKISARQESMQPPKQLQQKPNIQLPDKKKHNTRLILKKHKGKYSPHQQHLIAQAIKLKQKQHKLDYCIKLSQQQSKFLTQPRQLKKQQPLKQEIQQPAQSQLQQRLNSYPKERISESKSKHKQQEVEVQLKIQQPIQSLTSSPISHERKHLIICANISFESCKNNFSYLCSFCSTNFENLNAFSAHLIRLHSTEIENEINSKTSNNSCTITRADKLKQNTKQQTCGNISIFSETYSNLIFNCDFKFDCNFCDNKFKNIIEFSEHMGKNHLELLEKDKENCMEFEDDIDIDPSCILSFDQIEEIEEFNPKFNSTMMCNNNNNNINNKIIMSVPISDTTEIFMTIDINENNNNNNNNTNIFNNNLNNKIVQQQQQQHQQNQQHIPMEVDIIEKPKFKLNIKHSSWATRYFN